MTEQTYTTEQYEEMADQLSAEVPRFNIEDERNQAVLMLRQAAQMMREREAGGVAAWLANDGSGRVIEVKTKDAGSRASATASATSVYSIPLYAVRRAAVPEGLLRWVKAQADDPDANERFRELYAMLAAAPEVTK